LAEIPSVVIKELHDAIEAELAQPTRSEMVKNVVAARGSRQFDDTDPNMLAVFGPNFSDCAHRTPRQMRKLADKELRNLRRPSKGNKLHCKGNKPSKGNKRYCPQPDGIGSATKCALIASVKLDWPGVRTRQAQAACQALYAAAGGDVKGTPNRTDGFWRDHLRAAQRLGRDHRYRHIIERALTL
jgi:hypothetical protein